MERGAAQGGPQDIARDAAQGVIATRALNTHDQRDARKTRTPMRGRFLHSLHIHQLASQRLLLLNVSACFPIMLYLTNTSFKEGYYLDRVHEVCVTMCNVSKAMIWRLPMATISREVVIKTTLSAVGQDTK